MNKRTKHKYVLDFYVFLLFAKILLNSNRAGLKQRNQFKLMF